MRIGSIGIAVVCAGAAATGGYSSRQVFDGPGSSAGHTVKIEVHDTSRWDADWYTTVSVFGTSGTALGRWQGSSHREECFEQLRTSMRWSSPTVLEFTAAGVEKRIVVSD